MPLSPRRNTRAVLFDLDGTLYRAAPMRRRMLRELALAPLRVGPGRARRILRHLRVFRSVREELRDLGRPGEPLEELQYRVPAERMGEDPGALRVTVEDWMLRRPLRHLGRCARRGLGGVLAELARRDLRLGVFSDYPVEEKLEALGVRPAFDLRLCALDREVNAFKPHPRGFLVACERWGVEPGDVLYVGDRADVDERGAREAGMPCLVVGADRSRRGGALKEVLDALES